LNTLKKFTIFGAVIVALAACGGGGGGSDSEDAGGGGLDCSNIELNEQNCYLGYIGLSAHDKQCCDGWIAAKKKQ